MSIRERRAEEKQRRRESIIDAGEAAFAKKGFERTTMADVASHARLSRALLYVYFQDKEDLSVAVTDTRVGPRAGFSIHLTQLWI